MPQIKEKSSRNKTINFTEEEGSEYLKKCLFADPSFLPSKEKLTDCIICGDTFELLPKLPEETFPLVIANPPYNLSKQYNSSKFAAKNHAEYKSYTKKWLELTLPLLTKNGSMYICVDWQSSIIVGEV